MLHKVFTTLFVLLVIIASAVKGQETSIPSSNSIRRLGDKSCNYKCPNNSYRKQNRDCYDNFDDCECNTGWYKKNGSCHRYCTSTYTCPKYWQHKRNLKTCYNNKNDCECASGYKKDRYGYCVTKSCNSTYECPAYSTRLNDRSCYDSFDDCKCNSGYYKYNGYCKKD